MGTSFGFLRVNGAVAVDVANGPNREGVVIGADRVGLALMCVRRYSCTGWRIADTPKREFVPWSNILRVQALDASELEQDGRQGVFDAAGYLPHEGMPTGSRAPFQEPLR